VVNDDDDSDDDNVIMHILNIIYDWMFCLAVGKVIQSSFQVIKTKETNGLE
jgi:hypothetical protein